MRGANCWGSERLGPHQFEILQTYVGARCSGMAAIAMKEDGFRNLRGTYKVNVCCVTEASDPFMGELCT